MTRVLVTGSAGAIGRPVCAELLRAGHHVRGFDLVATPGVDDAPTGDVADYPAVLEATRDIDAIVHLAAVPNDAPLETLVGPNVLGVHHVLEAARTHGVRRVVLTSTVQTVGFRARTQQVSGADREPNNHYALTKLWAEDMGEMYSRLYGLSVVAPRIGWMVRNEGEAKRMIERGFYGAYLSPRDAARFYAAAVAAPDITFVALFVIGPEGRDRFDLETAERVLGWVPHDRFPEGLPFEIVRPTP